jgi:hypothetical protein
MVAETQEEEEDPSAFLQSLLNSTNLFFAACSVYRS